jgi:hypothetical protein
MEQLAELREVVEKQAAIVGKQGAEIELPDHFIVGALESEFDYVSRAGERLGQLPDEVSREVLSE